VKIRIRKGDLGETKTEAAVVIHFEDETDLAGSAAILNRKSAGVISDLLAEGDFTGRLNQVSVLYTRGGLPVKRIVLVGLGKRPTFTLDKLRGAFAKAAQQIRSLNIKEFSTAIPVGITDIPIGPLTEAVVEGVILGLYQFTTYKTKDRDQIREIVEFSILHSEKGVLKSIQTAAGIAETISAAVCYARDLVSTPGNDMRPTELAGQAKQSANNRKIRCRIIEADQLGKMGMNALFAVGSGSADSPKLIVLEYRGGKKNSPFVALVGKGLTFDSGGISIKPSEKMDQMKTDMAGGAAVIAAVRAAADLALPVNIVGLVPVAENLPSGKAYRPGDILKSLSGQTIEIITTDAEGRLILADALTYAGRYKPAAIIDLATLTGACIIALGEQVTGMLGNDEGLKGKIRAAADFTSERVWELPLWEEYDEQIKSDAADYKNSGGRGGGAITAAAFLAKFTGDYPWVHLDIAGPSWLTSDRPYIPKGASGVGVRLLVHFLRDWCRTNG
jgi:leucyl aminopeptidase